ncbi:DUF736 domain-containing protein [Bradyrhizobium sp. 186]|nr:DUF736 domain-containing protein [Bradyrhizobium sp. 186]
MGAAWQKTAKDTERDYLSVKLDDPSFPTLRSTPPSSRWKARKVSSSSGPAPAEIEAPSQRPRRKAGRFAAVIPGHGAVTSLAHVIQMHYISRE